MSAVHKCSIPNRDNLMQPIHMHLSQKVKTFSQFFPAFSKYRLKFEYFQTKKMTLIAYLSLRLRPVKIMVRYMCQSPASDYPSKRNMTNEFQLCLNLSSNTCTIFIDQRAGILVAKSFF